MKRSMVVMSLFVCQLCYPQANDSTVTVESKTRCMQLVKEYADSVGVRAASYYDVKHDRCYAVCTSVGDGFITTTLDDIPTGEILATAVYGRADPSGVKRSSWGVIGKKRTSYEKAMEFINRLTQKQSDK